MSLLWATTWPSTVARTVPSPFVGVPRERRSHSGKIMGPDGFGERAFSTRGAATNSPDFHKARVNPLDAPRHAAASSILAYPAASRSLSRSARFFSGDEDAPAPLVFSLLLLARIARRPDPDGDRE